METIAKSKALEEFKEAAQTLVNPALQDWMDQDGKVVGYFCSYGPQEIITAAGFFPFRMRGTGNTGTELADAYLTPVNCSFIRHCLNLGLLGDYEFIDGLICINTCDNIRRVYDNWKRKVDTSFIHIISLPKKTEEPQVEWFRGELAIVKDAMEKHFDVEITDERMWEAIRLHNETRRLQRELYAIRKRDNPPITGAETLAVTVAGTAMPRERYNQLLRDLLDDIRELEENTEWRARLLITGSVLDDPEYIEAIEAQGGLVVADSLCFGSRNLWNDVDEDGGDPLTALARYYIAERPQCPRMLGTQQRRADFIKDMIQEFNVDGVIGERMMFCDYWVTEHYILGKDFKEEDIPFLRIDREYLLGGVGQLKTRVQAFLETMGR